MKNYLLLLVFSFLNFQFSIAQYHLDPAFVSESVELPRTAGLGFEGQYLQSPAGWEQSDRGDAVVFRARYKIPFAWIDRRQFLRLERVSGSFDVVINGHKAGYSQTGSSPTELDITELSREGSNELEIVVYKNFAASKLENFRLVTEPGIEGEVCIVSQPRVRVRDFVADTRIENSNGLLELGVVVKTHQLNPQTYTVLYELRGADGKVAASEKKDVTIDMRREDTVHFFANIRKVMPWSEKKPNLYTLVIKTQNAGRVRETLTYHIGFRAPDSAGGRIVVADIDTHLSGPSRKPGGNPSNDPQWLGAYLDRTLRMYHNHRNDPSVAAFALAHPGSANGYCLYETYLALKTIERSRPVIYPDGHEWNSD